MDLVLQVVLVRSTGIWVEIIRPFDVEGVTLETFAEGLKAADEPQIHAAAPRKH